MSTSSSPSPFQAVIAFSMAENSIFQLANPVLSSQDAITAYAGGGQTNAVQLTGSLNNVTVVANAADSVRLPMSAPGKIIRVSNNGANSVQVFGYGTETINSVATATGVSQVAGSTVEYECFTQGNWVGLSTANGNYTGTFDGILGGNTPAAATVTTLVTSGAITAGGAVNKVTITAPASSATLTIANAKTLTVSNTLTLAGTDSTVMTFPTTSATIARTDAANTFTGTQTIGALVATGITQAPVAVGASASITAVSAGKTFLLDTAAGSVATLPAATGTGNVYKFAVSTSATSNAHKILAASGSDFLLGNIAGQNSNTVKQFTGLVSSSYCSLQMPFAGTQPSGGIQGDWFEFTDIAANKWAVKGMYSAGVTPTTPFSTATS